MTDAWNARYGDNPITEIPELASFLSHRSVRHYEDKPIDDDTLTSLVAVAQSAATSSNLQLWSIIEVSQGPLREKIAELCGRQKSILTCARFLAFCADTNRMHLAGAMHHIETKGLSTMEFLLMSVIDASLAAERLVCADI